MTAAWRRNHPPSPSPIIPTVQLSSRRCIHCGFALAAKLVEAEPEHDTHPSCDSVAVWLHHQIGTPTLARDRK